MSKKTLLLIVLLVLATVTLIAAAVSPSKQPQTSTSPVITKPSPVSPAQTTLALSPSPVVVEKGASSSAVNVVIDTKENRATAVQLELTYNPKAVDIVDVAPGTFFSNPVVLLKTIDRTAGRVSYALGIAPTGVAQQGEGVVATLMVRPVQGATITQTQVSFLPKTLVTAEGVTTSVLKSSSGTNVVLSQ